MNDGASDRATTRIDTAALDAAERFVLLNARLLERRRFAHLFRGGTASAVVDALRPYANPDGGFGNGLEPDLRGADSQPEPVAMALRVLHETTWPNGPNGPDAGAAFQDPIVIAACDWLSTVTRPDGGLPWVLPSVTAAPAAPWWQPEDGLPGSLVPTAAIAGLLHHHRVQHPWLDGADRFCRAAGEAVAEGHEIGPYHAHDLLVYLDHAPDREWADATFARLRAALRATAAIDPDTPGHVHMSVDLAPTPRGFGRRLFSDAEIDLHLDRLVAGQADDGGWTFNWEPWAEATVPEWRGIVTVERLKTLRAYGRWAV